MRWLLRLPALVLLALVRLYQIIFRPILPPVCRFQPSCSDYALEALRRHGALRGGWLTVRRLCRCNPFGGSGHDPVP
jgi:putative membrane protein insertion efficiency factor